MTDKHLMTRRGEAARRILADENIMAAFGEVEADLLTEWASTNPNRPEDREAIYRQVKALELFQTKLESWRDNIVVDMQKTQLSVRDQKGQSVEA